MKEKKCVPKRSKSRTFDPDKLVTTISQAIIRDLGSTPQLYGGLRPSQSYEIRKQTKDILKKYSSSNNKDDLTSLTFKKFLDVNEHMSLHRDKISITNKTNVYRQSSDHDKLMVRARALMHNVLGSLEMEDFYSRCKHSGGTTLGIKFDDTSMEQKFTLPITITEKSKILFMEYLRRDYSTRLAIEKYNGDTPLGGWYDIVQGSRAATVDKDDSIRRMIAIEPTGNMFLQQGFMSLLYDRMKHFGLDVSTLPEEHKRLARESSLSGFNATIDFSSASDCVSMELLEWLLPRQWFRLFEDIRSPMMQINGSMVELHMSSTMGNAGTFPLETLVFWTMAHAARLTEVGDNTLLIDYKDLKCCSVFGDDCILPSSASALFMRSCTIVGFIVNKEKSFYDPDGRFRESCGGDYLSYVDVRCLYLKAPTDSRLSSLEPWLYIILNGVISKYIKHFGTLRYIYKQSFFRTMLRIFRRYDLKLKVVPSVFPDDAGLLWSNDIERFLLNYPFIVDRVKVDKRDAGSLVFKYLSFKYRESAKTFDDLRYAHWLKTTVGRDSAPGVFGYRPEPHQVFVKTRRIGGYVTAKTSSSFWSLPR